MYFGHGYPLLYKTADEARKIVALLSGPRKNDYFLVLSPSAVQLWKFGLSLALVAELVWDSGSGSPRAASSEAVAAQRPRSPPTSPRAKTFLHPPESPGSLRYDKDRKLSSSGDKPSGDYNVDACWNDDGSCVAVLRSSGSVTVLRVVWHKGALHRFEPSSDIVALPPLPHVALKVSHSFGAGIAAIQTLADDRLLAVASSSSPDDLLDSRVYLWSGELAPDVVPPRVRSSRDVAVAEASRRCVVSTVVHSEANGDCILVALYSDGVALVALGDAQQLRPVEAFDGVAVVAVNERKRLLALGLLAGGVRLVRFCYAQGLSDLYHWSPAPWGVEQPGPVATLAWSPDGHVVAAGWRCRGLAAWTSLSGCLLFHTFSTTPSSSVHLLDRGVASLLWGPEGTLLLGLPAASGRLFAVPFARATDLSASASPKRVFLQAHDRLLLWKSARRRGTDRTLSNSDNHQDGSAAVDDDDDDDDDDVEWEHVAYPQHYIFDNWPVRLSGASPSGAMIFVAGRQGFAVYTPDNCRWLVFCAPLHCTAFAWLDSQLLVGSDAAVKLFDPLRPDAPPLASASLPAPARHVQALHDEALVLCSDGSLCIFDTESWLLVRQLSFAPVCADPLAVTVLSTHTRPADAAADGGRQCQLAQTRCVVQTHTGFLSLVVLESRLQIGLQSECEAAWCFAEPASAGALHARVPFVLFDYGTCGLRIWTQLAGGAPPASGVVTDFSTELFPVGVLPDRGLAVGLRQTLEYRQPNALHASWPRFALHSYTQTYIHAVVAQLLAAAAVDEAAAFCRRYDQLDHFVFALELLLFHAVHSERADAIAAAFLRSAYPRCYAGVVVRCARKVDPAYWPALFDCAGDPEQLCDDALAARDFCSASAYLRTVQQLKGAATAVAKALQLLCALDPAADADRPMIDDLVRFVVHKPDGFEADPALQHEEQHILARYTKLN